MIRTVAVESNEMKPLNSTLALGFYPWVSTEGRAKWLFLCLSSTAVLHTIVSVQSDGVEEKGYMVCRKARGQFPNNPCDWSNHQVEGHSLDTGMMMPQGGETPEPSYSMLGVGGSLGEIKQGAEI
jgi:hypothetical protein